MPLTLEERIGRGAQELIEKAIEVEVQERFGEYRKLKMLGGRRAVVRNGYLPELQVLTSHPVAAGLVDAQFFPALWRRGAVRGRAGSGALAERVLLPTLREDGALCSARGLVQAEVPAEFRLPGAR